MPIFDPRRTSYHSEFPGCKRRIQLHLYWNPEATKFWYFAKGDLHRCAYKEPCKRLSVPADKGRHPFLRNQPDNRNFDGIRVATTHRVKGLEFKYVFIAALNHRVVPLAAAINHMDPISEKESITSEKCLLYVAMTRAQKGVYITSYGTCSQFLHQSDWNTFYM